MDYSSEQHAIIKHDKGHALVHAVPGSGKTHSLVGRVEHLLASGVTPEHIVVIMYGKDPCRDFIRRLENTSIDDSVLPRIKTFHSIAGKYLHTLITAGLIPDGNIPEKDKESFVMQQLYQKACKGLTKTNKALLDERTFLSLVTKIKANVTLSNDGLGQLSKIEKKAFLKFEKHRKEAGIRTFDDLLYDLWTFMREKPFSTVHKIGVRLECLFHIYVEVLEMSDGQKIFAAVKQSLTKLFPKMTGHETSNFGTLLHMVSGMIGSHHCQLPKISGKIKSDIKQESQIKKLKRWLDNKDVNGNLFFCLS